MSNNLPDQVLDQGFEDTESIDDDIDHLFQKFITPIERIRSISQAPPGKFQSNQKQVGISNLKIDPVNSLESRCHAFYRMMGFPVLGGGNFYNPGFSPIPKISTNRDSINSSIDQQSLNAMNLREQQFQLFSQMFASQGLDSTVFGIIQRHTKLFNMLDSNTVTKSIDGRQNDIDALKKMLPDLATSIDDAVSSFSKRMGYGMTSAKHIIKPFNVNPAIDFVVMPANNKVCVPFLSDINSTKISASPDIFLIRPGIEYIIRARLKDSNPDPVFLTQIQNIITQNTQNQSSDVDTIKNTIEALANQNNIQNPDVTNIFATFSSTQVLVVNQLVKTLKVVISLLHDAVTDLDKVESKITFLPIPSPQGFEKIGTLKDSAPTTKLENDIVVLTIKKLNADQDIAIDRSLGTFATSTYTNLEKTDIYSQQLDELTQLKTDIGNKGLQNLRTIELITGEASGFGLIDILAIYTALWAIKIEELLGFLDSDSFDRLYNLNPTLRSDAVMSKKNGSGTNITDALSALEQKVGNILSFADLIFTGTFISPQESQGGDPT